MRRETLDGLADVEAGRLVDGDEDLPVRQWATGDHVVRYVVRRDGELVIVRIWPSRQAR